MKLGFSNSLFLIVLMISLTMFCGGFSSPVKVSELAVAPVAAEGPPQGYYRD